MNNAGKRIAILSEKDIQCLYGIPTFSFEERVKYFSLNSGEFIPAPRAQGVLGGSLNDVDIIYTNLSYYTVLRSSAKTP